MKKNQNDDQSNLFGETMTDVEKQAIRSYEGPLPGEHRQHRRPVHRHGCMMHRPTPASA